MNPAFSVCVYCGSKPGLDPAFALTAHAVGRWIGAHGERIVELIAGADRQQIGEVAGAMRRGWNGVIER